jgi:hypothetical protein
MASFVVETYVPGGDLDRFAVDVDGIQAAVASAGVGWSVHHIRSYLVPSDEMGYHVVEAATPDDVARLADVAHLEVERIVQAIGVGASGGEPGTGEATTQPDRAPGRRRPGDAASGG